MNAYRCAIGYSTPWSDTTCYILDDYLSSIGMHPLYCNNIQIVLYDECCVPATEDCNDCTSDEKELLVFAHLRYPT
jgi:hypothetical protein